MSTQSSFMIRRAVLSVTDKTGIVDFGNFLSRHNAVLIASGGTYDTLETAKVPVTSVQKITGYPEILNGRVKTLHPKIHGGIMADRGNQSHRSDMQTHNIDTIELLVCNLYDFKAAAESGASDDEIIEAIDIGGVAMIRAAAKNFQHVLVIIDPIDYREVIKMIEETGDVPLDVRFRYAEKAFKYIERYDGYIVGWFQSHSLSLANGPRAYS